MMIAMAIWAIGYGFELASDTLDMMLFWIKIEYIGISFAPGIWLWFCINYAGLERWTSRNHFIGIFVVPVITYGMVLTNNWHHFHYAELSLATEGPFPLLAIIPGPWYYIHILFFYLCLLAGNVFLFFRFKNSDSLYRKQTYLLIAAGVIPWTVNLAYMLGYRLFDHIDFTPFAFLFVYIIVAIGLLRYRLFNIRPIARDKVIQVMAQGVLILDSTNRIIDLNPKMYSILNNPEKPIGMYVQEYFPDQIEFLNLLDSKTSSNTNIDLRNDGQLLSYFVDTSCIFNRKNEFTGLLVIFNDITESRKKEKQLNTNAEELKQMNSLKDKLFSIISHDLKGPIFGIQELLKLTEEGSVSKDEFFEIIPDISKNINSVSTLLENLLAWTSSQLRGEFVDQKEFDLGPLLDHHFALFHKKAKEKRINLKLEKAGNLKVFADRNMIDLVIRNLLSNAVKFSGLGDQILFSASEALDDVLIEIIDTGMGISESNLQKLNSGESFTTSGKNQEMGTGLGLILVKEYVQKNGGNLIIKSELNKGSVFSFRLPKNTSNSDL